MNRDGRNGILRLPDFIAVGPPRTATTWLHEVLAGHVCLPTDRKETDFFNRFYDRGLDWYANYFRACDGVMQIGEAAPMVVFGAMAAMLPDIVMKVPAEAARPPEGET